MFAKFLLGRCYPFNLAWGTFFDHGLAGSPGRRSGECGIGFSELVWLNYLVHELSYDATYASLPHCQPSVRPTSFEQPTPIMMLGSCTAVFGICGAVGRIGGCRASNESPLSAGVPRQLIFIHPALAPAEGRPDMSMVLGQREVLGGIGRA